MEISAIVQEIKQTHRLTFHYTVTVNNGIAIMHHAPFTAFYFSTKRGFLKARLKAYRKLAQSKRTDIKEVNGYSFWIDYAKDGYVQHREPAEFNRDILSLILLWTENLYNWRPSRAIKLAKMLHNGEITVGIISWEEFVKQFG